MTTGTIQPNYFVGDSPDGDKEELKKEPLESMVKYGDQSSFISTRLNNPYELSSNKYNEMDILSSTYCELTSSLDDVPQEWKQICAPIPIVVKEWVLEHNEKKKNIFTINKYVNQSEKQKRRYQHIQPDCTIIYL